MVTQASNEIDADLCGKNEGYCGSCGSPTFDDLPLCWACLLTVDVEDLCKCKDCGFVKTIEAMNACSFCGGYVCNKCWDEHWMEDEHLTWSGDH